MLLCLGIILIVVGTSGALGNVDWFNETLKSLGIAIIGGGVFTSLIHSGEFIEIYSRIFDKILWSTEFLRKRGDIRKLWSDVSKVLYDEKFPDISDELENIIATEYFPVNHEYYGENYDYTYNIISLNEHFWEQQEQHETVSFTLKTVKKDKPILYKMTSSIPLPPPGIVDMTSLQIEIEVNQEKRTLDNTKVWKWDYSGIILPKQGFIIIFKQ